ncbi:MAG: hypothetical protein Q4Q62_00760 [Thermoplasmata archaeon]|nr:hypothetical protein [Thermoplasmata archaeon]
MAKENKISLTAISMTPKTAKRFCAVAAVLIVVMLAVCAVNAPQGGHGHGGSSGGGQTVTSEGVSFSDSRGTITATGLDSGVSAYIADGLLTVPSTITSGGEKNVTAIGSGRAAFLSAENIATYGITSVSFPSTITTVNANAFSGIVFTDADGNTVEPTAENIAGKTLYVASA